MIPLHQIHEKICIYYDIEYLAPFLNVRRTESIYYRQIFMYLARVLNKGKVSLNSIGNYYSDVTENSWTHASVINSVKRIEAYLSYDKQVQKEIRELTEMFPKVKIENE